MLRPENYIANCCSCTNQNKISSIEFEKFLMHNIFPAFLLSSFFAPLF
jgi:hypothetical protein